jgi:alpha-galactosidase
LTSFQGQYLKEMQLIESKLLIRTVDLNWDTRAMLLKTQIYFVFGKPASETEGTVM